MAVEAKAAAGPELVYEEVWLGDGVVAWGTAQAPPAAVSATKPLVEDTMVEGWWVVVVMAEVGQEEEVPALVVTVVALAEAEVEGVGVAEALHQASREVLEEMECASEGTWALE